MSTIVEDVSLSLETALARVGEARVAVFGDFSLDAYWPIDDGDNERSIETGLPVWKVRQQRYGLGGAGNIVANLIDMGVRNVQAVGVVGGDLFGGELLRLLSSRGADVGGMLTCNDWQTMVYAKPYRGDVEGNRLDFGAFSMLSQNVTEALIFALDRAASAASVVVLNQQIPAGVSSPEVIARINSVITAHANTRFIVDSRHRAGLYHNAIFKLNIREACCLLDEPSDDGSASDAQTKSYVRRVYQKTGRPVFLTRGEDGILVADQDGIHEIHGIQVLGRTDPVGAGDAVVATLSSVLATGGDARTAARLANVVASITVRKLQTTGTATPVEIRAAGSELDYVYRPELASDPRQAKYLEDTEIELISEIPANLHIRYAVFDHDGTLSTLREGWDRIMESMMARAVLGSRYGDADSPLYRQVADSVRQVIDKTTGMPTLIQMREQVQLIRQFGFVPPQEILDEYAYKRSYGEQLSSMVRQRIRKLERGELGPEDFQIKKATHILQILRERGVKLYLASGTDEADVIAEAKVLGYADLFEGRIFGAGVDGKIDAKKMVLDRIAREHGARGHEIVTFGDGPAEIRETCKRGGICVGVASDESRRFGINLTKRARLIRAGADLIVPDFSQPSSLLKVVQLV